MNRPGRNDPCPCGSGKKYKKCCLASVESADSESRRWHQVEAGLIPLLITHAFETFGETSLFEAWAEFNGDEFYDDDDPEPYDDDDPESYDDDDPESYDDYDPASPMNVVFMPWFLFNWTTFELIEEGGSVPAETTVAESFMRKLRSRLSQDEVDFLSSSNRPRFTLCEIVEIKPGVGMKQFDLLRRKEYEVIEHTASQTLRRGDIIYCATTRVGEVVSNLATGPYPLRPIFKRDVLDLRKWILADSEINEITGQDLYIYESDIRDLYLDSVDQMFNFEPDLTNTDNEPMVPQKLYFDIASAQRAFHSLKDLAEGMTESDLLVDAQLKEGELLTVEIPWLGGSEKARRRLGGPVLLGIIRIDQRQMIIEVNSNERAESIRQQIEDRLGEDVTYRTTLVEPLGPLTAGTEAEPSVAGETADVANPLDDASPELLAKLEEVNRKRWDAWFDDPIPALNDMTPREASRTEEGRDLLSSLLLDYEQQQEHSPNSIFNVDIAALRAELGLK